MDYGLQLSTSLAYDFEYRLLLKTLRMSLFSKILVLLFVMVGNPIVFVFKAIINRFNDKNIH